MKAIKLWGFGVLVLGLIAGPVFGGTEETWNTFYGLAAGTNNSGIANVFLGNQAGYTNTSGYANTFVGFAAGYANTTGYSNTFLGFDTGDANTTGYNNSFLGTKAGSSNTTGNYNTFLGTWAGPFNTTGASNTFIGYRAGYRNTAGNGNVFLGNDAGYYETGSDKLYIANSSTRTPLIYGEFYNRILTVNGKLKVGGGTLTITNSCENNVSKFASLDVSHYSNAEFPFTMVHAISHPDSNLLHIGGGTGGGNAATHINFFTAENNTTRVGTPRLSIKGNGYVGIGVPSPWYPFQLASGAHVTVGGVWTNASSRKYKDQIKDLEAREAVDTLLALNPVTFVYKADKTEKHVGFIAEDVPELLATRDRKGLSPMDIVAVLTKALQEQQKFSLEQQKFNRELLGKINELENKLKQMTAPVALK